MSILEDIVEERVVTDYFIFNGFYAVVCDGYQGGVNIVFISGSKADADKECEVNNATSTLRYNATSTLRYRVVPLRRTDRITVY